MSSPNSVVLLDSAGQPITMSNPLPVASSGGGGTVDQGSPGVASGAWWFQPTADGSTVSLPLPSGAATSALQTTGNASLSSIDSKTPALGQAAMAASVPVVIASNQSAVPVSGTVTANAGSGTFAVSAMSLPLPDGAATAAKQPALGTAGASSPDVLSIQGVEDGTPVPISGSVVCFPGDTQPVTGTVTANQGTAAAATAPWSAQLSDGAAAYTAAKTGQLPTTLGVKSGGQALGVAVQQDNYTTVLTSTTAGTQVFNGACCLRQVVILTGATSAVVSVSDGSGSAGTAWDIDASSRGVINLNVKMFSGIWVVISGGSPKVLITKD